VHILIVEDDERIIAFMKRGLEAESYEVDIASSKSQTLDRTEADTYDAIILDIFLGPDDGLDICRTLRQQGVGSPILLMTAKGTAEMEKMSKNVGADAYLSKPFSFDDLLATIARLCHSDNHGHEQLPGAPEKTAEAFTKLDTSRPTTMTASEPKMRECFTTHMNRPGKQP
jgi:two-component system, OmpR family, copper resistance phosphate regulon response regulator CusR